MAVLEDDMTRKIKKPYAVIIIFITMAFFTGSNVAYRIDR